MAGTGSVRQGLAYPVPFPCILVSLHFSPSAIEEESRRGLSEKVSWSSCPLPQGGGREGSAGSGVHGFKEEGFLAGLCGREGKISG